MAVFEEESPAKQDKILEDVGKVLHSCELALKELQQQWNTETITLKRNNRYSVRASTHRFSKSNPRVDTFYTLKCRTQGLTETLVTLSRALDQGNYSALNVRMLWDSADSDDQVTSQQCDPIPDQTLSTFVPLTARNLSAQGASPSNSTNASSASILLPPPSSDSGLQKRRRSQSVLGDDSEDGSAPSQGEDEQDLINPICLQSVSVEVEPATTSLRRQPERRAALASRPNPRCPPKDALSHSKRRRQSTRRSQAHGSGTTSDDTVGTEGNAETDVDGDTVEASGFLAPATASYQDKSNWRYAIRPWMTTWCARE